MISEFHFPLSFIRIDSGSDGAVKPGISVNLPEICTKISSEEGQTVLESRNIVCFCAFAFAGCIGDRSAVAGSNRHLSAVEDMYSLMQITDNEWHFQLIAGCRSTRHYCVGNLYDRNDQTADIDGRLAAAAGVIEEIITVVAVLLIAQISITVIICVDF